MWKHWFDPFPPKQISDAAKPASEEQDTVLPMNEKSLRRRLTYVTICTILIGVALFVCSIVILNTITRAEQRTYRIQIEATITERKMNMAREFSANMRTLQMLSSIVENTPDLTFDDIIDGLNQSILAHQFLRMGYYALHGPGLYVMLGEGIQCNVDTQNLDAPLLRTVEQAWTGNEVISDVYYDNTLQQSVLTYAVPVYNSNEILVGALCATQSLHIFTEIFSADDMSESEAQLQWINQQGEYLLPPADNAAQKYNKSSIFDGDYVKADERAKAVQAMAAQKKYQCTFAYDGKRFPIYFMPLEQNGWYLLCIDWSQGANNPVYPFFLGTLISFGVFFILFILLFVGVYYSLRRNNEELIQMAYYDALTGSYNFSCFQRICTERFLQGREYSIAVLNIRRFQYINEILGRKQADRLLCEIAQEMENILMPDEAFCRYTGDQFYLLLRGINQTDVEKHLLKVMGRVNKLPHKMGGNFPIIMYVGVAVSTPEMKSERLAKMLIYQAEFALKHAPVSTENTIIFYNNAMYADDAEQNAIENNMKSAMQNGEFRLWLQPKFRLSCHELCGAEALVRWVLPDGKILYPDQFIPLFERNGFCVQFDLYMIAQVCSRLHKWIQAGIDPIPISVNQSKLLFYQTDYVENLCEITNYYQIPRHLIILEILEGVAAENIDLLNTTVAQLQQEGFRLSLDDFGSGYSSLTILSRLPIDEVKLDRSFLAEMEHGDAENQYKLMQHIVSLAHDLGMRTVIEGIETKENETLVRMLGCDIGQGYYYSEPIRVEVFERKYFDRNTESE